MIRLEGVHKAYGDQEVLTDVSFEVKAETVTTIIGSSGAGKSVLLRHMIGLAKPDRGSIFIAGENIVEMKTRDLNRIRRKIGVLFQDAALFDSLSVGENVAFPVREHLRLPEKEVQKIVDNKLAMVGLRGAQDKYPAHLSGGMRKRVGLARALALDPSLVFFDEPTTGLDPITRAAIYRLIVETHEERATTYVLVSHDIRGALEISDDVMMLLGGKIAASGTADEIRNSPDPAVQQFLAGSPHGPIVID